MLIQVFGFRLAMFASLLCLMVACGATPDEEIIIKGSTTMAPVLEKLVHRYQLDRSLPITVESVGTQNGLKALMDGKCHLAGASAPVSPIQKAAAEAKRVGLKSFLFGYDLIVPIVHPRNPVQTLEIKQLKDIYRGVITNWQSVGGQDARIVVVTRDKASGTRHIWDATVLDGAHLTGSVVTETSNSSVLAFVATNENAIGYVSFAFVNREVRALAVGNISPTIANGIKGVYPIFRKLFIYADDNHFSADMKALMAFILGPTGQDVVQQNGFVPAAVQISEDAVPGT